MNAIEGEGGSNKLLYWLAIIATVVGLYLTTKINYLLFHTIVELFSIIVAASVFIITWNSVKYIKNPYLIMVGISYLFIGILDLLHTLSYKGMPIFTDYDYYANQLWIAARFLESITLITAFSLLFTHKKVRPDLLVIGYSVITSFLVASIFYWKTFPICFIAGKGLTPFKVGSEYVICAILAVSLFLLVKNRTLFQGSIYRLLLLSIVYTIISELAFTFYIDNYGISNLVGHYFKLFSFVMIYQAIISTGIEEPYHLIFKELSQTNRSLKEEITLRIEVEQALKDNEDKLQASYEELQAQSEELYSQNLELAQLWEKSRQSEAELQKLNEELDRRVAERTTELRQKDHLLMQQSRLAAMGEMINNIAHQWRQPLNALGLLVQQTPLFFETGGLNQEFLDQNANKSMELIQHMSHTIDDFRNFFKPDKEKVHFSVKEEVSKTLSLIDGSLKDPEIAIAVEVREDPVIFGFPNEFAQVLINILMNARDAASERNIELPRVLIRIGKNDDRAVVTIADNAGGIPEEIIGEIFAPYFTTKGPDRGTGVGLFMSKKIIENNMGGRLSVANVPGGAQFTIQV